MSGLPLNIDLQQILLHILNFVLLTGGMYFLLYSPVKKFMDTRRAYYQSLEDKAEGKLVELDGLKEEYQSKMSKLTNELGEERKKVLSSAQEEADRVLSEAEKEKQRILDQADREGRDRKERIVEEARGEIVRLAIVATKKLLAEAGQAEKALSVDEIVQNPEGSFSRPVETGNEYGSTE